MIESKREKRKQYIIRKKALHKQKFSRSHISNELLEENLCKRWTRREEYSHEAERLEKAEELMMGHLERKKREEKILEKQQHLKIKEEHNSEIQEKYSIFANEALYSETDSLFLPKVASPMKVKYAGTDISVQQTVNEIRAKHADALNQVQVYRNLAERLQREKRDLKYRMEKTHE